MSSPRSLLAACLLAAANAYAEPAAVRCSDGRFELAADAARGVLIARDAASGAVLREIPLLDRNRMRATVARIVDAAPRKSFVVLFGDAPEAWELTYDPNAEPVYEGFVHDFRLGEGIASHGPLARRRIELERPLFEVLFAPDYAYFVGRAAPGELHVGSLAVRRKIETLRSDGDPRPAAGVSWTEGNAPLFALPDATRPRLWVLDGRTWRWRAPIALPAPATQVRRAADGALEATVDGRSVRIAVPLTEPK